MYNENLIRELLPVYDNMQYVYNIGDEIHDTFRPTEIHGICVALGMNLQNVLQHSMLTVAYATSQI